MCEPVINNDVRQPYIRYWYWNNLYSTEIRWIPLQLKIVPTLRNNSAISINRMNTLCNSVYC